MGVRTKRIAVRLGLVCASFIFALLLAEVGLRLFGIGASTEDLSNYQFDEELGWVPFADHRLSRSSPFFDFHFEWFDAHGFPTTEEGQGAEKDRDAPSIALIGDSYTEGFQLRYEETFAHRLDLALPEKQVLNLGVGGYSPAQYLLSARNRLEGFRVTDIVVVVFPFNDLPYVDAEVYQEAAKPHFDLADLSRPTNVPLPDLGGRDAGNPVKALVRNSALYTLLRPWIRGKLFPVPGTVITRAAMEIDAAQLEKGLRIVKQIQLENPEAGFFVYFVPLLQELRDEELHAANSALIAGACEALELPWHSPAERFLADADPQRFYIPGDEHFTAEGAAVVAAHLQGLLAGTEED